MTESENPPAEPRFIKELFPTPGNTLLISAKRSIYDLRGTITKGIRFIAREGDYLPFCVVKEVQGKLQLHISRQALASHDLTYTRDSRKVSLVATISNLPLNKADATFSGQRFSKITLNQFHLHPSSVHLFQPNGDMTANDQMVTVVLSDDDFQFVFTNTPLQEHLASADKNLPKDNPAPTARNLGLKEHLEGYFSKHSGVTNEMVVHTLSGGFSEHEALMQKVSGDLESMAGVLHTVALLRRALFTELDKGVVDQHIDPSQSTMLKYPRTFLDSLRLPSSKINDEIAKTCAKIRIVSKELSNTMLKRPNDNFLLIISLRLRLMQWTKVLTEIGKKLQTSPQEFAQMVDAEYQNATSHQRSFQDRLQKILSSPSGKKSLLGWIDVKSRFSESESLVELLSDQILLEASVIDSLRLLERIDDPYNNNPGERVDLVEAKERVEQLKREAQRDPNPSTLSRIDKELINIIIPIGNRVAQLFPHDETLNVDFIPELLFHGIARCAGKATIVQVVLRYLGLSNTTAASSLNAEFIQNGHELNIISLFSTGKKLVMDANYSNEVRGTRGHDFFYNANNQAMPSNSRIYLYTISNTPDDMHDNANSFLMLFHDSPDLQTWFSSIPFPHNVLALANPNSFLPGSAYLLAAGRASVASNPRLSLALYEKGVKINPNDQLLAKNYACALTAYSQDTLAAEAWFKRSVQWSTADVYSIAYGSFLLDHERFDEAEYYLIQALIDEPTSEIAIKKLILVYEKTHQPTAQQFFEKLIREGSYIYRQEMFLVLAGHFYNVGNQLISRAFVAKYRQSHSSHRTNNEQLSAHAREVYHSPAFAIKAKLANTAAYVNKFISKAAALGVKTEGLIRVKKPKPHYEWNSKFSFDDPLLIKVINSYLQLVSTLDMKEISFKIVQHFINEIDGFTTSLTEDELQELLLRKREAVADQSLTTEEKAVIHSFY